MIKFGKPVLVLICCMNFLFVSSQTVKINNGISISSMSSDGYLLDDKLVTYSFSLGYEYLENKLFYFSSEIGYMKLGGKEKNAFIDYSHIEFNESWNYIHTNTTFRLKYNINSAHIFIGAGPKADFLVGNNKFKSVYFEGRDSYEMKRVLLGAKLEVGAAYDVGRLRLGLGAFYLLNMGNVGTSEYVNYNRNAYNLYLSIGYRFTSK